MHHGAVSSSKEIKHWPLHFYRVKFVNASIIILKGSTYSCHYDAELKACCDAALAGGGHPSQIPDGSPRREFKKTTPSPVTEVDKKCEDLIRTCLQSNFPATGFSARKPAPKRGQSGRKWIVDPLDGNRPYLRGIPRTACSLALEDGNELVSAALHLHALNRTFWRRKRPRGAPQQQGIHVSKTTTFQGHGKRFGFIEKAVFTGNRRILSLMKTWDYAYGFMDAYSYGAWRAGSLDVCATCSTNVDCAAAGMHRDRAGEGFPTSTATRRCITVRSFFQRLCA